MEAFKRIATQGCVIIVITLALFAGLEATARFAQFVRSRLNATDDQLLLKQPWGKQLLADSDGLKWRYENYVEFRERAMQTSTINVDGNGRRVVPGNCRQPGTEPFLILLFGGSTMFGYWVPDQHTIPAYLARALGRQGRCVKLVNYGAAWWQSSQSVIQLLKALREGMRPNAVVFYDGINDVSVVIDGGAPGGITPDAGLRLGNAFEDATGWQKIIQSLVLVRVTAKLLPGNRGSGAGGATARDAAKDIVRVYVHNVRSVEALAGQFGFTAYYFLQPYPLIADKVNTDLENAVIRSSPPVGERDLGVIRAAYDAWRIDPYLTRQPRYFDISRLFDGMTEELYVDDEHLLPEGNRLVAERIAREIR